MKTCSAINDLNTQFKAWKRPPRNPHFHQMYTYLFVSNDLKEYCNRAALLFCSFTFTVVVLSYTNQLYSFRCNAIVINIVLLGDNAIICPARLFCIFYLQSCWVLTYHFYSTPQPTRRFFILLMIKLVLLHKIKLLEKKPRDWDWDTNITYFLHSP